MQGQNAGAKTMQSKNAEAKVQGQKAMQRQKVQSEKIEQTSESDLLVACCLSLVVF